MKKIIEWIKEHQGISAAIGGLLITLIYWLMTRNSGQSSSTAAMPTMQDTSLPPISSGGGSADTSTAAPVAVVPDNSAFTDALIAINDNMKELQISLGSVGQESRATIQDAITTAAGVSQNVQAQATLSNISNPLAKTINTGGSNGQGGTGFFVQNGQVWKRDASGKDIYQRQEKSFDTGLMHYTTPAAPSNGGNHSSSSPSNINSGTNYASAITAAKNAARG